MSGLWTLRCSCFKWANYSSSENAIKVIHFLWTWIHIWGDFRRGIFQNIFHVSTSSLRKNLAAPGFELVSSKTSFIRAFAVRCLVLPALGVQYLNKYANFKSVLGMQSWSLSMRVTCGSLTASRVTRRSQTSNMSRLLHHSSSRFLRFLTRFHPDCVLTIIRMPRIGGWSSSVPRTSSTCRGRLRRERGSPNRTREGSGSTQAPTRTRNLSFKKETPRSYKPTAAGGWQK